jgi:hypothetical protein
MYVLIFDKNGFGYILGDFFSETNLVTLNKIQWKEGTWAHRDCLGRHHLQMNASLVIFAH